MNAKNSTANDLEVRDIHSYIGQSLILDGVDFVVPEKSITVLLGRNGAGKTTTLRSIMGLVPPATGEIILQGQPIHSKRSYQIAQLGIGFVPDYRAVFKHLTVEENLLVAERSKGDLDNAREFIYEIFPDLEIFSKWAGGQLSGGQQQMLAVARALVAKNQLLLIDEPSEGLAPVIIEQMLEAIRTLSADTTVLLVEQNFHIASLLADRFVIIENGQSVESGPMSELVSNEAMITKYLSAA